ncbi:MAG: aminotransferase class IV family protein [Anaerolineae bacterium]|nr:aminotransferase class IV family protein [Anaerolineae bacterium]
METETPIIAYRLTRQGAARLDSRPALLTDIAAEHPGVYTATRTYHRDKVLEFGRHLARLDESARLLGIRVNLDSQQLRMMIKRCVDEAGFDDVRFCLSVPADAPDTYYLCLEPFQPVPEADRRAGVAVYTVRLSRRTPRAKSTAWIAARREARTALPDTAYEGILVGPDGALLEGMRSNFYAVHDGALWTAGDGVLGGTARAALLEFAPEVVPVHMEPVTLADLPRLSEAMLTSSSRGVVPIARIDGRPVNGGRPGPVTQMLAQRYDAWTEAHLEPLYEGEQTT